MHGFGFWFVSITMSLQTLFFSLGIIAEDKDHVRFFVFLLFLLSAANLYFVLTS